jgi:hypothetical protein
MLQQEIDEFRYSAEVDMWMDCGPHGRVPLRQISSTFVITAEPREMPVCEALIVYTVDGRRYARPVVLVNGMSKPRREVMVLSRDEVSPF